MIAIPQVDWEAVARDRMITNGHAARMRFSRFKSAQEGTQSKPRKPRAPRESPVPRGAKAHTAAKKSKSDKDKQKEKRSLATPPATPIKSDQDDDMAIDTAPLAGMNRQLRLPTESASFVIKPDPDAMQEDAQDNEYIKTEPDVASETSLESADFGQAVDMLEQVNIDKFSEHQFYSSPSTSRDVMTPRMMPARDGLATPEMTLSPSTPPSLQRSRMTPELAAPRPLMRVAYPERALFHRHYNNGLPVLASASGLSEDIGKDFVGFEEYMRGCRSARDVPMRDREPVVKEEQNWEEGHQFGE